MESEAPRDPIRAVRLFPIGRIPDGFTEDLAARVSAVVPLPCRVHRPQPGEAIDPPMLAGRDQVDADGLLSRLERLAGSGGEVWMGLTVHDIGSPIFAFFFGRSRLGGRAALVSLARLTPRFYGLPEDPALTLRRATLEVLHELGHSAGLEHCREQGCVMHFAPSVEALDLRGRGYCASCAGALPAPSR